MISLVLLALVAGVVILIVTARRRPTFGGLAAAPKGAEREVSLNARLYVAGIIGGLLAVLITVVLVFQFGRHDPSPPSLRDNPNPAIPGKILYVNEKQCVVVAEASGASSEEVYCFGQDKFFSQLFWVDEDTFAYVVPGPTTGSLVEVDINTGEESPPRTISGQGFPGGPHSQAPDGTSAQAEEGGKIILVESGVRTEIADFDVPRYNWPQPMLWSPDSQWLLVQYYPPRGGEAELWIISRDGETRGTLAKDALGWSSNYAWWIEGIGAWPELPE